MSKDKEIEAARRSLEKIRKLRNMINNMDQKMTYEEAMQFSSMNDSLKQLGNGQDDTESKISLENLSNILDDTIEKLPPLEIGPKEQEIINNINRILRDAKDVILSGQEIIDDSKEALNSANELASNYYDLANKVILEVNELGKLGKEYYINTQKLIKDFIKDIEAETQGFSEEVKKRLDPLKAEFYHCLADVQELMNDTRNSIESLKKALDLNPNDFKIYDFLYSKLMLEDRFDDAQKIFEKFIDKKNAGIFHNVEQQLLDDFETFGNMAKKYLRSTQEKTLQPGENIKTQTNERINNFEEQIKEKGKEFLKAHIKDITEGASYTTEKIDGKLTIGPSTRKLISAHEVTTHEMIVQMQMRLDDLEAASKKTEDTISQLQDKLDDSTVSALVHDDQETKSDALGDSGDTSGQEAALAGFVIL